jgi:predicted GNAT family acetyltransferase
MSDAVVHVPQRSRFELADGDDVAVLVYEQGEGDVALLHTVVPPSMEGRGVGSRLAEAAVGWAREQDLDVVPVCSFVQGWLARHPDALRSLP